MKKLLDVSSGMKLAMTAAFKELQEKRDLFKVQISQIQSYIDSQQKMKDDIRQQIDEINEMEDKKLDLDKIKMKQTQAERDIAEDTPYHNTSCTQCNSNCHVHCGLNEISSIGSS